MGEYDLTFFKFLGGLVAENNENETSSWKEPENEDAEVEHEFPLAPPRPEDHEEVPANTIIFNSLWASQNKRSSVKAVAAGKVNDIKSRFEKGKRVMSGVFSAISGGDKSEKPKEAAPVKHHEIPSVSSIHKNDSAQTKRPSVYGFQGLPKNPEHDHEHARKPKGPPPPIHAMTLAKGWNSGLPPTQATKGIPAGF